MDGDYVMISVLAPYPDDLYPIVSRFEDFDEYSWRQYYLTGGTGTASTATAYPLAYEVTGGYLSVLRKLPVVHVYQGVRCSPLLTAMDMGSACHLLGKTKANLYSGRLAGRSTAHIIGWSGLFIPLLAQILRTRLRAADNPDSPDLLREPTGVERDLNACLTCFDAQVF